MTVRLRLLTTFLNGGGQYRRQTENTKYKIPNSSDRLDNHATKASYIAMVQREAD